VTLFGVYRFDTLGTAPFPITVSFSGTQTSNTGRTGSTSFVVPTSSTITPGGPADVPFTAPGLKPGIWTVTASPSCCGGIASCTFQVPAPTPVILDVSGGQGLHCR
jgi:hypothetical protein